MTTTKEYHTVLTHIPYPFTRTVECSCGWRAFNGALLSKEGATRAVAIHAKDVLHAEYRAYLCMMSDHGCECVALTYLDWLDVSTTFAITLN